MHGGLFILLRPKETRCAELLQLGKPLVPIASPDSFRSSQVAELLQLGTTLVPIVQIHSGLPVYLLGTPLEANKAAPTIEIVIANQQGFGA